MAVGDHRLPQKQRRKTPSFSSSLLDAIYHSIDDPRSINNDQDQRLGSEYALQRKNDAVQVEEEIESLRRAIMVEKWMESYSTRTKSRTQNAPGHLSSNSNSSTDSSIFSSVETDSASRTSASATQKPAKSLSDRRPEKITIPHIETTPKKRFMATTKTRAMKIYGDLKKVKEPISPGGRISNFLNAIFSPRNPKKNNQALEEWNSVRKSRSTKDTATCSLASRSCLSKNVSSSSSSRGGNNKTKSKRSVRFCPVSVIVDEDSQPCGHKNIYYDNDDDDDDGDHKGSVSMPSIGSQFIKKNIDSLRLDEGMKKNPKVRKNGLGELYEDESSDVDDMSCASSDLFELENIGAYEEELPVYETTSFKMNQAIASGLVMY